MEGHLEGNSGRPRRMRGILGLINFSDINAFVVGHFSLDLRATYELRVLTLSLN